MRTIGAYASRRIVAVPLSATAGEAARRMAEANVGAVVVRNGADGDVQGVVTERDLARLIVGQGRRAETPVAGLIGQGQAVPYVQPDDEIRVVSDVMREAGTRYALVVEPGRPEAPVGIVAMQDLLRAMMDQCMEDQEMLKKYIAGSYA